MTEVTTRAAAPPARLRLSLPAALKLDALVSGANGLAYLVAAERLAGVLGLPRTLLLAAGTFLVAYGAFVWFVGTRPRPATPAVIVIVVANTIWALDSTLAALAGWGTPSAAGMVWLLLQAGVVAVFAALQLTALRAR